MVRTRSKLTLNKPLESSTTTNIFDHLIPTLESSEGIKSQLLKSLYYLLIQLSKKQELCTSKGANLNELCVKTNEGEVRLNLKDVYTISLILFKDLQKRLKQLHSSEHDVSASRSLELEELKILIRCCMVILTFPVPQKHLLESGRVLLLIFKKWSLLEVAGGWHEKSDFKKSISCQCMYGGENSSDSFAKVASLSFLELCDPCIPSIAEILEVVIDELLVHGRLRKYLPIIDSFSPEHEHLFKLGVNSGDFGVVMEMICSHFSLSISNERALQEFFSRNTWVHFDNSKSLELSIIASRTLLHNPVVLSSPKLFQAHIVSLVSNVISVTVNCERLTPDPKLVDCYLSVFEVSVLLYTQHMSILETENQSEDARGTLVEVHNKSSQPSFESCIEPTKKEKLDQRIAALNESWNSSLRSKVCKKKSDLVASSIEYIQENLCIIDTACRDEIVAFLECMLMRAGNDLNDSELPLNGCASLQDICLLASLLMLMSNSLIQVVWSLRHRCPKSLKDLSPCKEYDFIVGIINCFKDFSIRLPIQKWKQIQPVIRSQDFSIMETNPTSHKESRLMLLHFLGLLSLCFDSGFDFLVKSCISVIMGLTNLFVLEEGNIDALRSLADPRSLSSEGSLTIYKEALVCQYPTLVIASKFQKIWTLYMSNASLANESTLTEDAEMEKLSTTLVPFSMGCVTASKVETCSGETYLKNRLKGSGSVTDFDDLADFVECKKGKDYADWLKGRDKFREQKLKKMVKRRWEKKKQAWRKSMRG